MEEGIERSEPVLVAVQTRNVESLRSALGGEPEGVTLLSVEQWYESSARTREKFARWAEERIGQDEGGGGRRRRVRLIGEPPWASGKEAHVRDWARHESVINVAFAGMPVTFICPYDTRILPAEIIEHAHSTHPTIAAAREWIDSAGYQDPLHFCSRLNERVARPSGDPWIDLSFGLADLAGIRRLITDAAADAGLPGRKAEELALALNEVTTNALVHGRQPATVRVWSLPDEVICEVSDSGAGIQDALAGQLMPPPEQPGGRGLWLARLLCDAVEIRSEGESVVSLHMAAGVAAPVPL